MNADINSFLVKFENWEDNFIVRDYASSIKEDELSNIVTMQLDRDVDGLLQLWEKKLKGKYFELPHPNDSKTLTRAVYNVKYGMANFVFMLDCNNENCWIFAQHSGMIDLVFYPGNILKTSLTNVSVIFAVLNKLPLSNLEGVDLSGEKWGVILSHIRPFHFFYDQLKVALNFLKYDKVFFDSKNSFFNSFGTSLPPNFVGLSPTIIPNILVNQSNNLAIKKLNENMEKAVFEASMSNYSNAAKDGDILRIWYGITGQKRSWLQQVEAIDFIVNMLLPHFSNIVIYIDGMTSFEDKLVVNKDDSDVFNKIYQRLEKKCKVYSLIGQNYKQKIQKCSGADFFIANAGTGCMVPLRFCKKPGVLHSNSKLFVFPDDYPPHIKIPLDTFIFDVKDRIGGTDLISYHIPWQHIYNLVIEILNPLKNVNLLSMDVPGVELVAKEYGQIIPTKDIFASLKFSDKTQPADALRDIANAFNKTGDLDTAYKIMCLALEQRPDGPAIKKRVDEWEKLFLKK